ncbi:MAG: DUF2314 domain-containing protein [Bacteroidota bacterium]
MKHHSTLLSVVTFVILSLVQLGCNPSNSNKVEREGKPTIYHVETEDQEMLAAIKKSRQSFDQFLRAYHSNDSSYQNFAIKLPFRTQTGSEHIWLTEITIENGKIFGVVNNEPDNTNEVKLGQKIEINSATISDWDYMQGNKLMGGYTIWLLRDRMSPQEREEFDKSTGLEFN